jgi:hypothetical protein
MNHPRDKSDKLLNQLVKNVCPLSRRKENLAIRGRARILPTKVITINNTLFVSSRDGG